MTLRLSLAGGALAAAAMVATAAAAHHGWSSYDAGRAMTPTAEIVQSHWGSPHGSIVIVVDGQRWDVVLAPVSRMQARGLDRADIAVGETVTVEGYPRRDGTHELRAERITAGGQTVELR